MFEVAALLHCSTDDEDAEEEDENFIIDRIQGGYRCYCSCQKCSYCSTEHDAPDGQPHLSDLPEGDRHHHRCENKSSIIRDQDCACMIMKNCPSDRISESVI
jgi:hypothetical protein